MNFICGEHMDCMVTRISDNTIELSREGGLFDAKIDFMFVANPPKVGEIYQYHDMKVEILAATPSLNPTKVHLTFSKGMYNGSNLWFTLDKGVFVPADPLPIGKPTTFGWN